MLLPFLLLAAAAIQPAPKPPTKPDPVDIEEETLQQLLTVRRVYIDRLSGGDTAVQMRDMIVASLQNSKLFVITENPERADAILRGSAEDLVFTDEHSFSDSIHGQASFGGSDSTGNSSNSSDTGSYGAGSSRSSYNTRDARSRSHGMNVGDSESSHSLERKHEAVAAVRLVSKDGDVIWSTTQESMGGKFRGSSADVADKITKKLLEDYERAKKLDK